MFLAQLAFRNLFRNLRRTVITSIAVVFGVALIILGWGLVDGLDENVLRAARTTATGDFLLRPEGYPTDGMDYPLEDAKALSPELTAALDATGTWTARVWFPARLVMGADAARVNGIGYDGAREDKVFPRSSWHVEGAWPRPDATEVGVGVNLARLLELKIGDAVTIEARTRAGAINALTFIVSAIVTTDNSSIDNLGVWVPMEQADPLLQLSGERTHVAVIAKSGAALAGKGWSVATTHDEVADLLAVNNVRRRALMMLVFVIMAIAATGIANTVIMSVFERVREVGTLLALGMRRAHVRRMFLLEGGAMGVAAGLLGATLGSWGVLHWQAVGIDLSGATRDMGSGMSMSSMLYTHFSWPPVFIAFAFGLFVSIAASIWPAGYAAALHPADSVRAD